MDRAGHVCFLQHVLFRAFALAALPDLTTDHYSAAAERIREAAASLKEEKRRPAASPLESGGGGAGPSPSLLDGTEVVLVASTTLILALVVACRALANQRHGIVDGLRPGEADPPRSIRPTSTFERSRMLFIGDRGD